MNFEQHLQSAAKAPPRPAQKVIEVPPEVWAPTWSNRPTSMVKIGLRLISLDADVLITDEADAMATAKHPKHSADWTTIYNDCLMRGVVLEMLCEPDDISKRWSGWVLDPAHIHLADTVIRGAVHRDGLKWFWREYERLRVEIGLLAPPADNATIQGIIEAMCPSSDVLKRLSIDDRATVIKYLGMNANPVLLLQWMTPTEQNVFRRYFGYIADTFMNALARGQRFPIDEEPEPLPADPDEESIAVLGNVVHEALAAGELLGAVD